MNEQLQAKLVEILAGIQSATKAAGDFALEQLPDIAQQYVMYGRVSSLIWVALGLAVSFGLGYVTRRVWIWAVDDRCGGEPFAILPALATLLSIVLTCGSIQTAALVWFAPKVWLLKEIAGLIK